LVRSLLGSDAVHHGPSPAVVEHTLRVNDCRIHFLRACRSSAYELGSWWTEEKLRPLTLRHGLLPDAYFQIVWRGDGTDKKASFFLEVERGAKDERSLAAKFRKYGDLYYGGQYEELFGARSLRVLFLAGSDYGPCPCPRVESLVRLCEKMDVTMVLFASLKEFLCQEEDKVLFTRLWRRPGYRERVALFGEGPRDDPAPQGVVVRGR